ncbi:unnamed protein product [Enterobius vermicularis]|uniref:TPT domain-containing protein n=1 Tax=Enterobius vermicularis TaxID=51028 RepID=A0A158Q9U0_ENTVE|nr:unnamed protein product [Enterobius vermicularis]
MTAFCRGLAEINFPLWFCAVTGQWTGKDSVGSCLSEALQLAVVFRSQQHFAETGIDVVKFERISLLSKLSLFTALSPMVFLAVNMRFNFSKSAAVGAFSIVGTIWREVGVARMAEWSKAPDSSVMLRASSAHSWVFWYRYRCVVTNETVPNTSFVLSDITARANKGNVVSTMGTTGNAV